MSDEDDLESVKRILREWDPIGVIPGLIKEGLPPDEYDSYAPAVLATLRSGSSVDEIAQHLGQLQTVSMGLGPYPDNDKRAATKLVDWWASKA